MATSVLCELLIFVGSRLEYFFQHLVYFFNTLISLTRILFQTLQNSFLQDRWKRGLKLTGVNRRFVHLLPNQGDGSIRSKCHYTSKHFVENQPQSIYVCAGIH